MTNQEELFFDGAGYEEFLNYAAAIVIAYMHGCRCGDCWLQAIGEMAGLRPCLSAAGAEAVLGAWVGEEARAIARRRRDRAPPLIDGDKTHRILNQPPVWKTVEAVTRVLLDGVEDEGEEPAEIARLLRQAGLRDLGGGNRQA